VLTGGVPGRRPAVVGVEVPATAHRVVAVHQVPQAGALPAVEVLHAQRPAVRRPSRELVAVAQELVGPHELQVEPAGQHLGPPGRRLGHPHRRGVVFATVGGEPVRQRRGPAVVDVEPLVSELPREAGHGGEDEVQALAVERLGGELRLALHQQDPLVAGPGGRHRPHLPVELVAEHPHRFHPRRSSLTR
jgi:hypothetical protein